MATYDEGFKAGQKDHAIGAGYARPDNYLGTLYQQGYWTGYFQDANELASYDAPVTVVDNGQLCNDCGYPLSFTKWYQVGAHECLCDVCEYKLKMFNNGQIDAYEDMRSYL